MHFLPKAVAVSVLTLAIAGCEKQSESQPQAEAGQAKSEMAASEPAAQPASANEAFIEFTDEIVAEIFKFAPIAPTSFGLTEADVGYHFADKLGDFSPTSIEVSRQAHSRWLEAMEQFDASQLTGTALTTHQVLASTLAKTKALKPYINAVFSPLSYFSLFPVTQLSGAHLDIPRVLQNEQPLTNEQDAKDYIARLQGIQQAFSDLALVVQQDVDKGLLPPKFAVEGAIAIIGQMTAPAPAEHPLAVVFKTKLAEIDGIDEEQKSALIAAAEQAVADSVYPGYAALKTTLETILPKASANAGIWDLKNGKEIYQGALENFGADGKTAEEIHQLGLSEVARIQSEMAAILEAEGMDSSDVIASYNALFEDPQYVFANTDEGRQELLDYLNQQMDTVSELLPTILKTLPKAPVEVRRIPEYEQDGSAGGYYTGPSLDGSRPGIYWINLKNTEDSPKFTLPTLTYHEASPGHHLQVTIAQEIQDMPMLRNMIWFSSYGEGWALYAEVLAKEMGMYKEDPMGDLGRLQSELFRAARLVVDTGLHHKQWSREEAIDYMHSTIGGSRDEVTREVERYSVWPGQACSYKLGQLKILELREQAKQALGEDFDLAEFNDQVLIHGSITLTVLADKIDAWIAGKKSA
ncbi:DUF885 domain-containing protein [Halioxenophilus aromaticivorans]|uniref:DUF885 family protein n=1 Tax=Halioxenophilus aromaticivorans TaxID=1306992 RepID=A0AAV3UA43_9ALTE